MPGPIPNRSSDLSRERDANRSNRPPLSKGTSRRATPYNAPQDWSRLARQMYVSVGKSGMSDYFEQSDWAMLYELCDQLSRLHKNQQETGKLPAILYTALIRELASLGMTEGERRRIRIELEGETDLESAEDAKITSISSYRDKLNQAFAAKEA